MLAGSAPDLLVELPTDAVAREIRSPCRSDLNFRYERSNGTWESGRNSRLLLFATAQLELFIAARRAEPSEIAAATAEFDMIRVQSG